MAIVTLRMDDADALRFIWHMVHLNELQLVNPYTNTVAECDFVGVEFPAQKGGIVPYPKPM